MSIKPVVKTGKKERKHLHLPIMYYAAVDDWAEKVGYKGFVWWQKLHTYVDRTDSAFMDSHIPYTLESLYKDHFKVSRQNFYTTIKPLWEFGLIDIVTYEDVKRNSQKPKNIIVYEYPFNDINRKYEPLEKLRDWDKDYQSDSKLAGRKGAFIKKLSTKEVDPSKNLRVENDVDNNDSDPSKNLRVHPSKILRVTRKKIDAINITNKQLITTNNSIHNTNNNSLSNTDDYIIWLITDICRKYDYTEREINNILKFSKKHDLSFLQPRDVEEQAESMQGKDIVMSAFYFANGLNMRCDKKPREAAYEAAYRLKMEQKRKNVKKVEFYNWLEERD